MNYEKLMLEYQHGRVDQSQVFREKHGIEVGGATELDTRDVSELRLAEAQSNELQVEKFQVR